MIKLRPDKVNPDWPKPPPPQTSPYAKHYGPGPHPGTGTPQSIHGGGRDSTEETDSTTTSGFRVNITFTDRSIGDFHERDRPAIKKALARFEEHYPGALPDEIEFRLIDDTTNKASAYVIPTQDKGHIIHLNNMGDWGERPEDLQGKILTLYGNNHRGFASLRTVVEKNIEAAFRGADAETLVEDFKEAVIFHELAHVASAKRGWGEFWPLRWPDKYPRYNDDWYDGPLFGDDPSVPSEYATVGGPTNPAEYFAEALTDVAYNGDDATEYSKLTHKLFLEDL